MTHINFPFSEFIIPDQQLLNQSPQVFSVIDLFDDWGCEQSIDNSFAYMALAKQHTFIIPTKRAHEMFTYIQSGGKQRIRRTAVDLGRKLNLNYELYEPYETCQFEYPLSNVWLGVHVENQEVADYRIPHLLKTPAVVRFLSCEPLLEKVILKPEWFGDWIPPGRDSFAGRWNSQHLHWVIVGGESGTGARPCHLDWVRSIIQQCKTANVSVFVKQLGSKPIDSNEYIIDVVNNFPVKLKDRKGGDINEFPEDLKIRQFPQ